MVYEFMVNSVMRYNTKDFFCELTNRLLNSFATSTIIVEATLALPVCRRRAVNLEPKNFDGQRKWPNFNCTCTEVCKIIPACLYFCGYSSASRSKLPQPARSTIFGKIG